MSGKENPSKLEMINISLNLFFRSLTHRKIMNFIPEEEWPRVFGSSVGGARRSSSSAQSKATGGSEVREEEESKVNGEEEEMNDGGGEFSATLSKEEASLARQVSEEIKAAKKVKTNDTDPTESFEPPMLPVRCVKARSLVFFVKLLLSHFFLFPDAATAPPLRRRLRRPLLPSRELSLATCVDTMYVNYLNWPPGH